MYCQKCGAENPDSAQLCCACSWVLAGDSITAQNPDAKTSGLAIAALVLAILAPFSCLLTVLPAIICGIVGLVKIEKSQGQLKGKGLAIAGIATPAFVMFMLPFLMAILMPALARVRQVSFRQVCAINLSGVSKAMLVYADEYNGVYPQSSKWCDLLIEHTDVEPKMFLCRGALEGPCNYALNENIIKLGPDAPPDMVLLFETLPGWNQIGGREILTLENHQGDGCNIAFNDGSILFVLPQDVNDLKWTAQ